jgi:flagellar biogenesis protein FliO
MLRLSPLTAVWIVLFVVELPSLGQQAAPAHSVYVQTASHDAPIAAESSDPRRLGPPSASRPTEATQSPSLIPSLSIPRNSMATAIAALAFVVGVFLFVMSLVKRNLPRSMQLLPTDVASVLGRMPLTGKQFAHLIKLGDKLVLVSISPTRIDTITEVTDPNQVARLLAICIPDASPQVRQDYDQILRQLAAESRGGLGRV